MIILHSLPVVYDFQSCLALHCCDKILRSKEKKKNSINCGSISLHGWCSVDGAAVQLKIEITGLPKKVM